MRDPEVARRTAENVRLAEEATQRRELAKVEEKRFKAEQEAAIYKEWLAGKVARDAEDKTKRDLAARDVERARKTQRDAIISAVRNDYPGMSVERRTAINKAVFDAPTKSYIFSGPGNRGKTTLMNAVAQLSHLNGKRVLWTTGMSWEADIRSYSFADPEDRHAPRTSAEGLANCSPCLIAFDEVDKINRTEWMLNHLHALIDAAKSGRHQIVMTTNLNIEEFKAQFGASLAWRLLQVPENNNTVCKGGLGCTWVSFEDQA